MIRRPCVYGLTPETLRRCWIAYAGRPASYCMVASSDIIVTAHETGGSRLLRAGKQRGVRGIGEEGGSNCSICVPQPQELQGPNGPRR